MALALLTMLGLLSAATARTDFTQWGDSVRVYFNTTSTGAPIGAAVTNFPLMIRLEAGNAILRQAAPGGADIRFTDSDGVELPVHIARWDTGFYRGAEVWTNVPRVSAGSASDYVVMWWGNPKAPAMAGSVKTAEGTGFAYLGGDAPAGGRTVFDTAFGYMAAWHLDEISPNRGTAKAFRDATPAANHGNDSVTALSGTGAMGLAAQFDPMTGDLIYVKDAPNQRFDGPMTFSAWIKGKQWSMPGVWGATNTANPIVRKGETNPNPYQFAVWQGRLALSLDSNDEGGAHSSKVLDLNRWIHVAGVWDGKRIQLYVDGKLDADQAPGKAIPAGKADARPLYIGGRPFVFGDAASYDYFNGAIDEVWVSRAARNKDWVLLAYENQRPDSKLLTFQSVSPPAEDFSKWAHSRKILFNTAAAGVDQSVSGFPLLLRLNAARLDFSQASPGGEDFRIADADGTPLPFEKVSWDPYRSEAEIWVRVPKIDGAGDSDYITIYWGNPDATIPQAGHPVFDTADGWLGVWHLHLGAEGKGSASIYEDATPNHAYGDDFAAANPEAAAIGRGQRFGPALRDYVRVPANGKLAAAGGLTVSAWVKASRFLPAAGGQVNPILRKGDLAANGFQFAFRGGTPGLLLGNGGKVERYATAPIDTGAWRLVAATWGQDGVLRLYVDGQVVDGLQTGRAPTLAPDGKALFIGGSDAAGADSAGQFDGLLDEIGYARVARPPEWMRLAYENQRPGSKLLVWIGVNESDTAAVTPRANALPVDTILAPGEVLVVKGLYQVTNPAEESGSARVRIELPRDRGERGIADARETILLEPAPPASPMPKLRLEAGGALPADACLFRSLAGHDGLGVVHSYGRALGAWTMPAAGEYFLGRDTAAPRLALVDEGAGDSNWVSVKAMDNVANLSLTAVHARGPRDSAAAQMRAIAAGDEVRIAYPGSAGMHADLLSVRLADGTQDAYFPGRGKGYYQMRKRLSKAHAPVGLPGDLRWRFSGIPLRLDAPLRFRDAAGEGNLFGARWVNDPALPARGSWRLLEGDDTVRTGEGIWLASVSPQATLPLGDGQTLSPGGEGEYRIALSKGWNQITCPGLEALPWPVPAVDGPARDKSLVKALLALDTAHDEYVEADTLRPWQGYFAYAEADTILTLGAGPLAKRSASLSDDGQPALEAVLVPGSGPASRPGFSRLRLGAAAYAGDGPGIEDEPAAPAAGNAAVLAIRRERRSLRTDLMAWKGIGEYAWRLAWMGPADRRPAVAGFAIGSLRLPPGMALWAVAPSRGLAEPLRAGSILEASGEAADTLWLWAGPAGAVPRWGKPLGPRPSIRSASWAGGTLRLALPEAAGVRAQCRDLSGRLLDAFGRNALPAGYHEFPLGPARAAGLRIVTVEFPDGPGPRRIVLKAIAP